MVNPTDRNFVFARPHVPNAAWVLANFFFKVTPISDAEEGSGVTIPENYSVDEYRLMGKITGDPPFKGVLLHKGWKTESVKLPRIIKTGGRHLPSIAPALVEIK